MTITVKLGTIKARWDRNLTFFMDTNDTRTMIWDYTGELGSDTVSAVTVTTENITAGSTTESGNTTSFALSAVDEDERAEVEVKMTSTAGTIIDRKVYVKGRDL